jgi:polar amino acid transport system substrate-binding protein
MDRRAKIGFDVPFEPFGLLQDGKPAGLLVELVASLLDRAGIAHEFETMPLAETESALFGGRVDALAFKGVTPERLATMTFSAPLIVSGGATFTRLDLAPSTDLADYAGKTLVTPRKGPLWAHVEKHHPAITLIDGDSYQGSFALLASGKADVAALNLHVGVAIAKRLYPGELRLPSAPYLPLPIAFAIAKNGPIELIEAINATLPVAQRDGTYQRIYDRWLAG